MIQLTANNKIYFAKDAIDFRCGIEKISAYCRNIIKKNPMDGAFFVFKNKNNTQLKILHYDGIGYFLCIRRFSKTKISWWPDNNIEEMDVRELQLLLLGINPNKSILPNFWKKIT